MTQVQKRAREDPRSGEQLSILCTFGGTVGQGGITGGDRYGLEVLDAWSRMGRARITIYTSTFGQEICKKFGYGLSPHTFEEISRPIGPWRLGYVARFLKQLVLLTRSEPASWGYAFAPFYYDTIPLVALRLLGRLRFLVVPVFHTTPPPSERGWSPQNVLAWLENRLMLLILRMVRATVVTDNAELVEAFVRLGFRRENLILSAMGVPEATSIGEGRVDEHFDCIYVGRLARTKGVSLLLEAWSKVTKELPNARLALVGSRDANLELDQCLRNLSLDDGAVRIFEGLPDIQVRRVLRASTCAVTASPEEGYCLAVAEAMREGLPCVTFDLPAFRLIYPRGRLIVMERTGAAFAEGIRTLLSSSSLRQRLILDMQGFYDFKSWTDVANDLWERCVQVAPSGARR